MLLLKTKKENLSKPLQSLVNIVERKNSLPILMNVLMIFKSNKLYLTTSDIDIEISCSIELEQNTEDQSLTVPAKKLSEILKNMSYDGFIELRHENNKLKILQNRSKYSLQILPADDFPIINLPPQPSLNIKESQGKLKKLISSISFSMAYQDVRYYLNGLFFQITSNELTAVATDGHRLAINSEIISNVVDIADGEKLDFIIPRKAVAEIEKLCSDSDETILLSFFQQYLRIEFKHIKLITKLIEGKYPDHTKVIPEKSQTKIEVNRSELLTGLQNISILTAEKYKGIKIHIKENKILLHSINADQEEAEEYIQCSNNELDINMGFNVSYLIEALSNINNDTVQILLSDPQSSALILDSNQHNFKYVVMPMRI